MARIRTIKPDFFRHEDLYAAEVESGLPLRLAFAGLWTVCDREGRFRWRPLQLKLDCLPYDNVDFSRVLDALATRGFIVRYRVTDESGAHDFGFVPSWRKHQVINPREKASDLPNPDDCEEIQQDADASITRQPRASETHVRAHGEREREKEGEREGEKNSAIALVAVAGDDRAPIARMVELYNQAARELDLPIARAITDQRRDRLRATFKRHGLDGWEAAMHALRKSGHCQGRNDRGWRADLDFLLQPASFVRLIEGRYEDRALAPRQKPSASLEAIDQIIAETERP
jgi:hypothetical protein